MFYTLSYRNDISWIVDFYHLFDKFLAHSQLELWEFLYLWNSIKLLTVLEWFLGMVWLMDHQYSKEKDYYLVTLPSWLCNLRLECFLGIQFTEQYRFTTISQRDYPCCKILSHDCCIKWWHSPSGFLQLVPIIQKIVAGLQIVMALVLLLW
jgi:hypothetical protein